MNTPPFDYANPYPYYQYLRKHNPVYFDNNGTCFVSRYADVKFVISDNRFTRRPAGDHGFLSNTSIAPYAENILDKWLILNDPPKHTRLRMLLSNVLDARFIKNMRVEIEKIAHGYLKNIVDQHEFDILKEFSYPYAISVISRLFGVEFDIEITRKWSQNISTALDHGTKEDLDKIIPDLEMLFDYFSKMITHHKQENDFLAKLKAFEKSGELSHDEVVSTCIFLALAGHETVQLTLGLGLMSLLKNPLQITLLQNKPGLLPSAIEEILRYESAKARISRWTSEDTQIAGINIEKNQLIVAIINSANRDETQFTSPDSFDVTRNANKHIALGYGLHHCLGALLSRIELNAAFTKLLPYLNHFELQNNSVEWLPNKSLRYLNKLVIRLKS